MVRFGTVISIDRDKQSGTIIDSESRKEFLFHATECEGEVLPQKFSTVSFIKDTDFQHTNVACVIKHHQNARAI